jgi:hypothetical protein
LTRDRLLQVYLSVKDRREKRRDVSAPVLTQELGMSGPELTAALMLMDQAGVMHFRADPWQAEVIPGAKGEPRNTPLWRCLEQL